jgi:hypothetical protein
VLTVAGGDVSGGDTRRSFLAKGALAAFGAAIAGPAGRLEAIACVIRAEELIRVSFV